MRSISLSVVIPVYKGETTLEPLIDSLARYFVPSESPKGNGFTIDEVLLVHDCGPDRSDLTIKHLCETHTKVKAVWLSKNFGQHPATIAGMSSAMGDWIVTMDEDGQHSPGDITELLDHGIEEDLQVVYAKPTSGMPHSFARNLASRTAKRIASRMIGSQVVKEFNSFRLIRGDVGRTLAAYCGNGVYLDVALLWVADRFGSKAVRINKDDRKSGYDFFRLMNHFWRMTVTSGPGLLRIVSTLGIVSIFLAVGLSSYVVFHKYSNNIPVQGWTSLIIAVSFFSGCILTSLGIIAEYLAASLGITMGKPLYVISSKSNRQKTR